jgi:hypothetical protein
VIWAAMILVPIVAMALIAGTGGYLLWRAKGPVASKRDMTGLEGVWRDEGSPKHVYRFHKDGTFENSWGGLPFGEFGTWEGGNWSMLLTLTTTGGNWTGDMSGP